MNMKDSEELIDLFRKFGGQFENVGLEYSEEKGFFCHTLDSNKETIVSCPAHLLVDCDDVGVNQHGLFIKNLDKYKNSQFLEKYFSFHFNRNMLDAYIEKRKHIDTLSDKDKSLLSKIYPPYLYSLGDIEELEFAKNQIFNSHAIDWFGKDVLMPVVTFLNYDSNGKGYDVKKSGITVSGKFNNEVCAFYNNDDVMMIAGAHHFVTDTKTVYSLPYRNSTHSGMQVHISRSLSDEAFTLEGFRKPLIVKKHNTISISWFPLYYEGLPAYPVTMSQVIASETGLPAEEFLYSILRFNFNALVSTAFQLNESNNPYAKLAAAAAQRQLELISEIRR